MDGVEMAVTRLTSVKNSIPIQMILTRDIVTPQLEYVTALRQFEAPLKINISFAGHGYSYFNNTIRRVSAKLLVFRRYR